MIWRYNQSVDRETSMLSFFLGQAPGCKAGGPFFFSPRFLVDTVRRVYPLSAGGFCETKESMGGRNP